MTSASRHFRIASIFIAFMAVLVAGSAQAQDYGATGPYAGVGFAVGFDNFDAGPFRFDPAYGFDVWGGYRFHPNFSGELQLEYLNGFTLLGPIKFQAITFTGNLKAYLLTGRWQPFALVGLGLGWQEENFTSIGATGFAARFGGGLDYYLTEKLSLDINAAYILQTGSLSGSDYTSLVIGAQYRF